MRDSFRSQESPKARAALARSGTHGLERIVRPRGVDSKLPDWEAAEAWERTQPWRRRIVRRFNTAVHWVWLVKPKGAR